MSRSPPPYRFFQSAILDPAQYDEPGASHLSHYKQVQSDIYGMHLSHRPVSPSMKIIVHASPATSRTWYIPKAILSRYSAYMRAACEHASTDSLTITSVSPSAFQNFVDFMHSSIYSVNKCAPDYHIVHSHIQAYDLGQKLQASVYQAAALRTLHQVLEPLARAASSSAAVSPIRASDVEYACRSLEEGFLLRVVLFDAIVSHWTQLDTLRIAANLAITYTPPARDRGVLPLNPNRATSWNDVYNKYPDFRERVSSSLKVPDLFRIHLLRPIEDYFVGRTAPKEDEFDDGAEPGFKGVGLKPRGLLLGRRRREDSGGSGHMRSPSRRRRSSAGSEGLQGRSLEERQVGENEWMTAEEA
ncbi:hypothetical protein N0V90_000717 [Kalmusia sp. IMI 367209]|nr:hypothetical protein N0V90_000717 [Kalmusia sp. IMI 367209]